MYKATSIARRSQMWILLGTSDGHAPDLLPGLVEVAVYWVDAGVMRGHCIAVVHWDVV